MGCPFVKGIRILDVQSAQAMRQSAEMASEQKGVALINANGFKHAIAIKEAAVEGRYCCLFLRNPFAVEKNIH